MLLHKIVAGRGERMPHVARSSQKHRLNPGGADTLDVSSGYHKVRGRGSLIVRENARAIVGKNVDVRVKDHGGAEIAPDGYVQVSGNGYAYVGRTDRIGDKRYCRGAIAVAQGNGSVYCYGDTQALVSADASGTFHEFSNGTVIDSARAEFYDRAVAFARGSSMVTLYGTSTGDVRDNATAQLQGNSYAHFIGPDTEGYLYDNSTAVVEWGSDIYMLDYSRAQIHCASTLTMHGMSVAVVDNNVDEVYMHGCAVLYVVGEAKAVIKDLGQANRVYVTDTASIDGVDLDDPRIVTISEGL